MQGTNPMLLVIKHSDCRVPTVVGLHRAILKKNKKYRLSLFPSENVLLVQQ